MKSRVDQNQAEIVAAIRSVPGWTWQAIPNARGNSQAQLGDGLLRASWWPAGLALHVEIKTAKGKLRPEQAISAGYGKTVVVRSFEELEAKMHATARCLDKVNVKFGEDLRGPGVQPSQLRVKP